MFRGSIKVGQPQFVHVGIYYETAEFAVESIRRWWHSIGSALYPMSKELLIIADGGGSNGGRHRLWQIGLQNFSPQTGLGRAPFPRPPATSQWHNIAPQPFSS